MRENYVNIGRRKQMRRKTTCHILIVVISAVIIFGFSLLLGNYLKTQVAALPAREAFPDDLLSGQLPADTSSASEVSIMASNLPLDSLSDQAAIDAVVNELTLGSREAVSLQLRDAAGNVCFKSTVAQNLTGQVAAGLDLSLLLPALREVGIYTSAAFTVTSFAELDAVSHELLRAYEISLAAEIAAAGVDELLLIGLPISVDNLDAVTAFLREIDAQMPESVQLAVAVPKDLIDDATGAVLIKQLSLTADTIALDLRALAATETQSLADVMNDVFVDASLYFSKYNMRVLLPHTDDATFAELRQVLELNAVRNWQVIE